MVRNRRHFRVSKACSGGSCLGVAIEEDSVALARLDDDRSAPLTVSHEEWAAFIAGVKNGEFDLD